MNKAGDIWTVVETPISRTEDSAAIHSLNSSKSKFVSTDVVHDDSKREFLPYRKLLHEVIVQIVADRQIISPSDQDTDYAHALFDTLQKIQESPEYAALEKKGVFDADSVTTLLDQLGHPLLQDVDAAEHQTTVIMGPPGSGKSGLGTMARQEMGNQNFTNSVVIDPDSFRPILMHAHSTFLKYSATDISPATQTEASSITDRIVDRIRGKLQSGRAPNVIMDIVFPWPGLSRRALLSETSKVQAYCSACPAEVCLERSHSRFLKTGRGVSSVYSVKASVSVNKMMPSLCAEIGDKLSMKIISTDSSTYGVTVAEFKNSQFHVKNEKLCQKFVETGFCNNTAKDMDSFYAPVPQNVDIMQYGKDHLGFNVVAAKAAKQAVENIQGSGHKNKTTVKLG